MISRPTTRTRLVGLVGAAILSLLALGLAPTADAQPQPGAGRAVRADRPTATHAKATPRPASRTVTRSVPNAEARAAGVQPGNAPMGWRTAELATAARRLQPLLRTESTNVTTSTKKLATMSGVVGIDVSSYQRTVNWASYKSQKRVFAYVKATEGSSYRSPYFNSQYNGAASAGLIRGAYHFANPSGASGKRQADYFVKYGGAWKADGKTLPGVLDIEYNPYGGNTCYGLSSTAMVKWIGDFLSEYKKLTKRDAVIYTTADWWKRCTKDTTKFSQTNPLWIARYGTSSPGTLPGKWPFYTFWQYSASPIDQDKFSAGYSRLQVLARGTVTRGKK